MKELQQSLFQTNKRIHHGYYFSPFNATIYAEKFENTYIHPEIKNDYLFHVSWIDDMFLIYKGWESKLNNVRANLHTMPDYQIWPRKINWFV